MVPENLLLVFDMKKVAKFVVCCGEKSLSIPREWSSYNPLDLCNHIETTGGVWGRLHPVETFHVLETVRHSTRVSAITVIYGKLSEALPLKADAGCGVMHDEDERPWS